MEFLGHIITSGLCPDPYFKQKFTLETDASLKGLRAVILQMKEVLLHPVSYARDLFQPWRKTAPSLSWKR